MIPGGFTYQTSTTTVSGNTTTVQTTITTVYSNGDTTTTQGPTTTTVQGGNTTVQNPVTVVSPPSYQTYEDVVFGAVDGVVFNVNGSANIVGHACQMYSANPVSLSVSLGGNSIGTFQTNVATDANIASLCQSTGTTYGFSIKLTAAQIKQYQGQAINITGISPVNSQQSLLVSSGLMQVPTSASAGGQFSRVNLVDKHSGKCLDVTGGNTADGTLLQQWDCVGNPQQYFALNAAGQLIDLNSGKCLDVIGGSTANGTGVQIWDCNGNPQQHWTYTATGQLVGIGGQCLYVQDSSTTDGASVGIRNCLGGTNQSFTLLDDYI